MKEVKSLSLEIEQGIDNGIRNHIRKIRKKGFETHDSCSGLREDHVGRVRLIPGVSIEIPEGVIRPKNINVKYIKLKGGESKGKFFPEAQVHPVKKEDILKQEVIKKILKIGKDSACLVRLVLIGPPCTDKDGVNRISDIPNRTFKMDPFLNFDFNRGKSDKEIKEYWDRLVECIEKSDIEW